MGEMLQCEILYSGFQCTKILQHYQMTYYDLIQLECPKAKEARKKYNEKTNILAYYVIKCIFLFHVNSFVQWCVKNNGGLTKILGFKNENANVLHFIHLIQILYRERQFITLMQNMDHWFQTHFHKIARTNLGTTMRMTLFSM